MREVLGGLHQHSKPKGVSSLGVISTAHPFYPVGDGAALPAALSSLPTHPGPPEFSAPGTKRTLCRGAAAPLRMTEPRDPGHVFTVLPDFA